MTKITYEWLFAYLERLGFKDSSPSRFERVFEHPRHGILFAFSMLMDDSVARLARGADLTSVEFRLQQAGLLSGTLADVSLGLSKF